MRFNAQGQETQRAPLMSNDNSVFLVIELNIDVGVIINKE